MPQLKKPGAPAIAAVAAMGLLAGGLIAATPTSAAPTNPGQRPATNGEFEPVVGTDNLPHPLKIAHKREAQKQAALQRLLETGQAFPQAARKGKGYDNQYVELEREGTDRIFVVLAEFGNERYPDPRFTDDPSFDLPDPEPLTLRRAAAQPDPRARPAHRQLHAVAARLQPGALRGHVLQPDGEVLRAPVLRPLLRRR